jgi:hypothetical protein
MIGLVRCADVQHSLPHQLSQLQAQGSGWSIADMLAHICAARRQIRSHRRRLMKQDPVNDHEDYAGRGVFAVIETDSLFVACQRCSAWPMAVDASALKRRLRSDREIRDVHVAETKSALC